MARSFILVFGLITWLIEFHNGAESPDVLKKSSINDKKFQNDDINVNEIELDQDKVTKILDTKHSIISGGDNLPITS